MVVNFKDSINVIFWQLNVHSPMRLPKFRSKPKYQKMLMASTMVDAIWKSRKKFHEVHMWTNSQLKIGKIAP